MSCLSLDFYLQKNLLLSSGTSLLLFQNLINILVIREMKIIFIHIQRESIESLFTESYRLLNSI